MTDLHLVYTDLEQFGFSVSSPQIPGLVGAWKTLKEAFEREPEIIAAVDNVEKVWRHEQKLAVAPNGD